MNRARSSGTFRKYLSMYWKLALMSIKAQARYPKALALASMGQFAVSVIEFLGMAALFSRFGSFRSWSLGEAAFLYGLVNMAFPVADALAYGLDSMGSLLRLGNFDRILVRPLPALIQLFGMELTIRRCGRLLQGLLAFIAGCLLLSRQGSIFAYSFRNEPLLAALATVSLSAGFVACVSVFISLFWIQASFTFVTIDGLEAMNAFTYGGQQAAGYPISAYRRYMKLALMAFVPIGSVLYLPVCFALGKEALPGLPVWLYPLGPLMALPLSAAAALLWKAGIRRYASGGA